MSDLHLCVGFYNNGQFVTNTVCNENLQSNIDYNKKYRPGRLYFVDGEHVCGGMLVEPHKSKMIDLCKQKIKDLGLKPEVCDSAPYM